MENLKDKNNFKGYFMLPFLIILLVYNIKDLNFFLIVNFVMLAFFGYIAALSDYKTKKVSNKLIMTMLIGWLLLIVTQLLIDNEIAYQRFIFGMVGFLFITIVLLLVYFFTKKGLGGADVKFMSVTALYIGLEYTLNALLLGSIFAAITGGALILLKKIDKKDTIPLIPFLYIGIIMQIVLN